MTAFQHNKVLGILHLAYAGFSVLVMIVLSIFMLGVIGAMAASDPRSEGFPLPLFAVVMIFVVVLNLLLVAPSFLAGYAFLKRKSWAKTMGLIAGIVAGLNFPFGSALCVYTLWFLFGEQGRFLYHKAAYALPPGPPLWARTATREPERDYVPPSTPPDWR
jgi:hypothetical protein